MGEGGGGGGEGIWVRKEEAEGGGEGGGDGGKRRRGRRADLSEAERRLQAGPCRRHTSDWEDSCRRNLSRL
eukprot:748954-Hanusia_phi.AAC.1